MGNLSLECPVCGKGIGIMEMPDFLDESRTIFCCRRCGKMKNLIGTEPSNARRYFSKYEPREVVVDSINALFEKEGVLSPYAPGGEVTEEEIKGIAVGEKNAVSDDSSETVKRLEGKVDKLQTGVRSVLLMNIMLMVIIVLLVIYIFAK